MELFVKCGRELRASSSISPNELARIDDCTKCSGEVRCRIASDERLGCLINVLQSRTWNFKFEIEECNTARTINRRKRRAARRIQGRRLLLLLLLFSLLSRLLLRGGGLSRWGGVMFLLWCGGLRCSSCCSTANVPAMHAQTSNAPANVCFKNFMVMLETPPLWLFLRTVRHRKERRNAPHLRVQQSKSDATAYIKRVYQSMHADLISVRLESLTLSSTRRTLWCKAAR